MKKLITLATILGLFFTTSSFAQIDTVTNLSDADKLYGLSKFWMETSYNFAYFDHAKVNWDSTYRAYIPQMLATKNTYQYYLLMQKFCALLKDGHTGIGFPPTLYKKTEYRWINFENFDKHFFVTDIPVMYKEQVPLGSELISVDGVPAKEYVEKELLPYISASTDYVRWNNAGPMMFYATDTTRVWNLKLRKPNGKVIDYKYQFHLYPAQWVRRNKKTEYHLLELKMINDIAFVKLNSFDDSKIIDQFKAILPQLYAAKGVILDIRDNGGGDTGIGAAILKYFTDKRLVGSTWRTRDNLSSFKAWGTYQLRETTKFEYLSEWQKKTVLIAKGDYWYKGDTMTFDNNVKAQKITSPLIVLTGNNTASSAEDFLIILDGLKPRATTMGQRTYGSTGQPLPIELPALEGARICTKRDTYPDGRDFVGVGVIPDIEIPRTVSDVISGTDSVLDAALKEIGKKIK